MNVNDSLERRLADFYESESPQRAPDWVLRSALQTIDDTPQRRVVIRVPWRFPQMNTFAKLAIAAVVVIAVGALGLSLLRPSSSSNVGGQPTPSPSASLSPAPNPTPSTSPVAAPALTGTFTSNIHGFSISYPAGWIARPATDPWTTRFPDFTSTDGDVFYDTVNPGNLWIVVASQPLAGRSGTQWANNVRDAVAEIDICDLPFEPITIDGSEGQLCGGSSTATVAAGARGYAVTLYASADDPAVAALYDRAYFKALLATLQLKPEDAVDTPPSASP